MKTLLSILLCVAACGTLCGKSIDQQAKKLPADVQKHVESIQSAALSNDWTAARMAYDQIAWRKVDDAPAVLAILSKELKGSEDAKELRREIKTKYELLRGNADVDLTDPIVSTPIPRTTIINTEILQTEVPQTEVPVTEVLQTEVPATEVLQTEVENIYPLVGLWRARYGAQLTFSDAQGNPIIPASGSVLGMERAEIIKAVEAGGDYQVLWSDYNKQMQAAIGRRNNLKRKP